MGGSSNWNGHTFDDESRKVGRMGKSLSYKCNMTGLSYVDCTESCFDVSNICDIRVVAHYIVNNSVILYKSFV